MGDSETAAQTSAADDEQAPETAPEGQQATQSQEPGPGDGGGVKPDSVYEG